MANFLKIWLFQIARQQKPRLQGKAKARANRHLVGCPAPKDVWQNYTLGALAVRKTPEGYVIVKMYNTSRNIMQDIGL